MPGLDHEFQLTLERVTRLLAQGDDPDALATLDDLVRHGDEDQIYHAMLIHEARSDFTRIFACLDRLEGLATTPDKRQWLSQQRGRIEAAQAASRAGDPVSLAPVNTGIDELLAPVIARHVSQSGH